MKREMSKQIMLTLAAYKTEYCSCLCKYLQRIVRNDGITAWDN
jgi:hypothetical protein